MKRIEIRTGARVEFRDITRQVQETVSGSGVKSGVCYVFVPHTTAGVLINEHADPSVVEDIAAQLESIVPQHGRYRHTAENNAPAHIKASLIGTSQVLLVEDGEMILGTWQGVFFCEFDGPRSRSVLIKVIPG